MSSTSVRKPVIGITSASGAVSAEGITFIAAVNSAPTVEVILRRAKEDVVRPLSSEVLAAMKAAQTARFTVRDGTPDTYIAAIDGNGGVINFSGFAISPVLEQSTITSAETVNVVGEDAFLNGLGLSIYSSRPENVREEEADALFEKTPSRTTGDIPRLLQEVTDVLVANLGATVDEIETESLKKVTRQKHAANEVALEVWKKILGNSDVKYPEWQKVFESLPKLGEAAAERTKQMLQQRTSSFWDVLNGLGSEFLFYYRPNMDGSSGMLVRADSKVNKEEGSQQAGVTRFTATDGNPSMLPLAGVIIYGPTLPQLRREEQPYSAGAVVGQFPVDITPGFFQETQAPTWLAAGAGSSFEVFAPKEVKTPSTPGRPAGDTKKNYDPTVYAKARKAEGKRLEAAGNDVSGMLQHYAKVMYDDMRLADSTATLEIPLDFTVKVGVRYVFDTGGEDGGKFTGFVRALRHTLQLQQGVTLTSATTLTLTHISYD